jgi:hypothetical protein
MKTIYSTEYGTLEEERKNYKDYLEQCTDYNEEQINTLSDNDEKVYEYINETVSMWYDDEKANLDKELDTEIIALADIGRWNGRVKGYKELGYNLNSIFSVWESCDDIKLFAEKGNIKGIGYHHDGTNYVTFRKWKKNISDNMKEKVICAIYNQDDNADKLIKRYTRSIYKDVANIYGW